MILRPGAHQRGAESGLILYPIDRILIATARLTGAVLVTRDERILRYARLSRVDTLAVAAR